MTEKRFDLKSFKSRAIQRHILSLLFLFCPTRRVQISRENGEGMRFSETLTSVVRILSELNATSTIGFGRVPLPRNVKICSRIWFIPLPEN